MYYSNGKLAIAQIPKAGLQSIQEWLGPEFLLVDNNEACRADTRVLFIRNPTERLESCYSFMCHQASRYSKVFEEIPKEWHSFVDYILLNDNIHWRPQTTLAGTIPTRIHRFEHINSYVDQYHPGILPRLNSVSRLPTDNYRSDDLAEFYALDFITWEQA